MTCLTRQRAPAVLYEMGYGKQRLLGGHDPNDGCGYVVVCRDSGTAANAARLAVWVPNAQPSRSSFAVPGGGHSCGSRGRSATVTLNSTAAPMAVAVSTPARCSHRRTNPAGGCAAGGIGIDREKLGREPFIHCGFRVGSDVGRHGVGRHPRHEGARGAPEQPDRFGRLPTGPPGSLDLFVDQVGQRLVDQTGHSVVHAIQISQLPHVRIGRRRSFVAEHHRRGDDQ